MKIIKLKNKDKYFLRTENLISYIDNLESKKKKIKKIEWEYVDADLEFLYGDHTEYEYWHEKLTDTVLDVPIEIVRHFNAAEICDSFTIKKPRHDS